MVLLVVDMQKALVDEDLYAFDTFLDRTVRLVKAARQNTVEVIFVQHDAGPGRKKCVPADQRSGQPASRRLFP